MGDLVAAAFIGMVALVWELVERRKRKKGSQ